MGHKAVYPGSFDPITYGHIDIIKRATRVFDEVLIAVAQNTAKSAFFSIDERLGMIREATQEIKGIQIETFDGLVIDYAKQKGCNVLIRGLRMFSDFEYELQMALTNRRLDETVETVFLMPSEGTSFMSSSLIKEAAGLGANIQSFVPPNVESKIKEKLKR